MNVFHFIDNRDSFIQELRGVVSQYSYESLSEILEPRIKTKQYGIGGKLMHRGPLCPNFMEEYLLQNIHRGRLYRSAEHPDYEYFFDSEGILVKVNKHTEIGVCSEYVFQKGNISYGINFTGDCHWKDGIYAVVFEEGYISATIYRSLSSPQGNANCAEENDVWTIEYKNGVPYYVSFLSFRDESDDIYSVGYRLETDDEDSIVRFFTTNRLYKDRYNPRKEHPFMLKHRIFPAVWRQSYRLMSTPTKIGS